MAFRTVSRDGSGNIAYVEYRLECTGSVVRLYRVPDNESGWMAVERSLDAADGQADPEDGPSNVE